jgi:hypothetical protein
MIFDIDEGKKIATVLLFNQCIQKCHLITTSVRLGFIRRLNYQILINFE